ncbi:uncharacterized protein LOC126905491 isoform X2 [Daktulosphaira vitifoliae]|nr:uncharacterized protein LOC126905491 isoform X2 [Daktulosphaira vitifoliae]
MNHVIFQFLHVLSFIYLMNSLNNEYDVGDDEIIQTLGVDYKNRINEQCICISKIKNIENTMNDKNKCEIDIPKHVNEEFIIFLRQGTIEKFYTNVTNLVCTNENKKDYHTKVRDCLRLFYKNVLRLGNKRLSIRIAEVMNKMLFDED